jgi:hypothetical protein
MTRAQEARRKSLILCWLMPSRRDALRTITLSMIVLCSSLHTKVPMMKVGVTNLSSTIAFFILLNIKLVSYN